MKKNVVKNILMVSLAALILSGCGGASYSKGSEEYAAMSEEAYTDSSAYNLDELAANGTATEKVDESAADSRSSRKLIRNVSITAQTTEYNELLSNVKNKINELGGYIESINETTNTWREPETHSASLIIRVPKDRADELISQVESSANITSSSENTEDVTLSYVDLESHKKTLEAEQTRLVELMERADTIEELITIENRLSEIRYQIESMESQLRTYDNKIDYTTINLNIEEVERIVPVAEPGFFNKVTTGFMESLHGVIDGLVSFIEWLIISSPYLVVWGLIITGIVIIIKKIRKKGRLKRAAEIAQRNSEVLLAKINPGKEKEEKPETAPTDGNAEKTE